MVVASFATSARGNDSQRIEKGYEGKELTFVAGTMDKGTSSACGGKCRQMTEYIRHTGRATCVPQPTLTL